MQNREVTVAPGEQAPPSSSAPACLDMHLRRRGAQYPGGSALSLTPRRLPAAASSQRSENPSWCVYFTPEAAPPHFRHL